VNARSSKPATLGFAPHSGWAALVAVGGDGKGEPEVLVRTRVEMTDGRLPGSKQPYHDVEGLPLAEAERRLGRYRESATTKAHAALRSTLDDLKKRGYVATTAGILESSGRKGASLASILSSHALIHTADGDHFRDALSEASRLCDLAIRRVRGKELLDQATKTLCRPADRLQESVKKLGRPMGPPWGADQKSAVLLAWLLLSGRPSKN
jgi:hypothetical protein